VLLSLKDVFDQDADIVSSTAYSPIDAHVSTMRTSLLLACVACLLLASIPSRTSLAVPTGHLLQASRASDEALQQHAVGASSSSSSSSSGRGSSAPWRSTPPVWPQKFKATLFQNRTNKLALTTLYYDW
jgi:hypothetical protein